jgi:hypothetical protein
MNPPNGILIFITFLTIYFLMITKARLIQALEAAKTAAGAVLLAQQELAEAQESLAEAQSNNVVLTAALDDANVKVIEYQPAFEILNDPQVVALVDEIVPPVVIP